MEKQKLHSFFSGIKILNSYETPAPCGGGTHLFTRPSKFEPTKCIRCRAQYNNCISLIK